MPDTTRVIPYQTPTASPKRVHPIVWWFLADGFVFAIGFIIALFFYHEQPVTYSAPPGVDALVYTLWLAAAALFVALIVWGAVLMFRRRGRVG